MKKYRCSFLITPRNYKEPRDIDFVFHAMNDDEACEKAMKVFLNDQIENETGLLDAAFTIDMYDGPEETTDEN